jgi:hypothetical protein
MDEKAMILQWIENWRQLGPELEAIRLRELAELTDEQAQQAAADLLSLPVPEDLPERESGLVEQQLWFMRARKA